MRPRRRRCTGWSKLWVRRAHEHVGNRTCDSPGRPSAALDPRGAEPARARAHRLRPDHALGRRVRRADDLVGAGPEPQPRDLAADPQHSRLCRRHRRRPRDADPRARRDHADPDGRGVGLAHDDPPPVRPRGAAARLLDSLHRDRGGLCQLLAAWWRLAAADRAWRRGRRCAGARARGDLRAARRDLSHGARHHPVRRAGCDLPDRLRPRRARA